jgi:hypothetical protein
LQRRAPEGVTPVPKLEEISRLLTLWSAGQPQAAA